MKIKGKEIYNNLKDLYDKHHDISTALSQINQYPCITEETYSTIILKENLQRVLEIIKEEENKEYEIEDPF